MKPSKFELEIQKAVANVLDFDPGEFDERFDESGEIISMDFQCELERLLRMRQVSVGIQIFMESFVREGIPGFELVKNTRLDEIVQLQRIWTMLSSSATFTLRCDLSKRS